MARRRGNRRRGKGSAAAKLLLVVFLFFVFSAGMAGWLIFVPYGPSAEMFVDLTQGSSALRIGEQLQDAGVLRSQYAFYLLRAWKRGTLKAGEYRFDHPASALEVYSRIVRGDIYTRALVVPEGSNIFDIAARVEQAGFDTRKDFLEAAVSQTSLVADFDPKARTLEGYLFPDTYRFARTTRAPQIAAAMVRRFRAVAGQLGLKQNLHQVVTIASLVQRETAVDDERPLIASVFENRLKKNMPLMTDPSVIYGLELGSRWRGTIYASDLKYDTAYNTYLHAGLPPGPISNPGIPSLRAAMHPADTSYLYFVAAGADAQGHSLFASTLDEHHRNVASYRRTEKRTAAR